MNKFDTIDIIAYYLSEYDMKAFDYLGYKTRAEGMKDIERIIRHDQSEYLKRLRDEFDAVTSSHRKGQWNRAPRKKVIGTKDYLSGYSFDELSNIVKSLIVNAMQPAELPSSSEDISEMSEIEVERIINSKDNNSRIEYRTSATQKVRIYDHSIIYGLKALYKGHCQLCGSIPLNDFDTDITEAHHIEYYSKSQNNNSSNIIIICPNHHRLIHKLDPVFDRKDLEFIFSNDTKLKLKLNCHIIEEQTT